MTAQGEVIRPGASVLPDGMARSHGQPVVDHTTRPDRPQPGSTVGPSGSTEFPTSIHRGGQPSSILPDRSDHGHGFGTTAFAAHSADGPADTPPSSGTPSTGNLTPENRYERSRVNAAADLYHKHIYSKITRTTARFTDRDFALTDLAVPGLLYAPEAVMLLGAYMGATLVSPSIPTEEKVSISLSAALGGAMAGVIFLSSYGINHFRTPMDRKMGIQELPFNLQDEWDFVIQQLNDRADVPTYEFDEMVPLVYQAVADFAQRLDGYSVPTTTRVKKSHFSRLLLWKLDMEGMLNPYLQEVLVASDRDPDALAHEFAHLQGIPQERFAQLVGVAAQLESGHPYLEYLGYKHWFDMLLTAKALEWEDVDWLTEDMSRPERKDAALNHFRAEGLNERTVGELNVFFDENIELREQVMSYSVLFDLVVTKVLDHMPSEMRAKVPEEVEYYLRRPEKAFADAMHRVRLKLSRQEDEMTAYTTAPLGLLHAYRIFYLNEEST